MGSDRPQKLWRGAQEDTDSLKPQPILESEQHRFPEGVKEAVFASQFQEEALAYSIASRKGLGGFSLTPYWRNEQQKEIGWKLGLNCSEADLNKDEPTYLYEVSSEGFSQNEVGEWYAITEVRPETKREMTVGEALSYFDEVKYFGDPEGRIQGEGN